MDSWTMANNYTAKQMKRTAKIKRTTQMLTNKSTAFQISYRQSSENNTRGRNRHLVYTRTIHNRK